MRIGIHPTLKRHDGGIYQYSVQVLRGLAAQTDGSGHEFIVFAHNPDEPILAELEHPAWSVRTFRPPWKLEPSIDLTAECDVDRPGRQEDMREWLLECGVELMFYPAPHRLSFETGLPFVMAIHDVQHRIQPEFPEVSAEGELRRREYVYRNASRHALRIVANSQTGRNDLLEAFGGTGLDPDRVDALPYPAPRIAISTIEESMRTVSERYRLPERFVFYPAQLWPHKNHLGLVEALAQLRKRELRVALVLAGSSSGEMREQQANRVRELARERGVADQIVFLGYVNDDDMPGLYGLAEALVMPTYFGPTSIPVLEAWACDCPVIASDVPGNREQVQDAGILVDPKSPKSIADGIAAAWTQPRLQSDLIEKGRRKRENYSEESFGRKLLDILNRAGRQMTNTRTLQGLVSCP